MNPNGTFGHALEQWLENRAPTNAPSDLHDAILERARTMRQRPGWIASLRGGAFPSPAGPIGSPVARLAFPLIVLGLVFALVVGAIAAGGLRSQPAAPPASSATPTAGPSAMAVPLPPAVALDPGTYFLPNPYTDNDPVRNCSRGCADYERIIFTLPAGWTIRDGLVAKQLDQPGEVAFSAWTVDQVYADPCHWQAGVLGSMPGAQDLATRLQNEAGRDASAPTDLALGGVPAIRVELSTPAQLDIASCDRGEFRSWSEWDVVDGANSHNAPGQLDAVYVVDVDRRPLVIDASHMPAASKQDLAELEAVLASMIIDRGPAWGPPDIPFPSARPIVDPSPTRAGTAR